MFIQELFQIWDLGMEVIRIRHKSLDYTVAFFPIQHSIDRAGAWIFDKVPRFSIKSLRRSTKGFLLVEMSHSL
jgi:hypothetical protein